MKHKIFTALFIVLSFVSFPILTFAQGTAKIDTGDTTFIIFSSALVFLMTPGVALFYGGMVRKKNVLNTMMNSFIIIAIVSIQWVIIGYTLAFGPDTFHIFGGMKFFGLNNIGIIPDGIYASTIPHGAFVVFQMMFAIITPALITGSFAERMRFPAFIAFVLLWSTLVYDPLAHWVWGVGGWLRNLGTLDFAGGTVVHISAGISGLVVAIVLGARRGHKKGMPPHNIPFVMIGASLLWFGWFGFNAGSALSAGSLAITAFITTNTAAAAAVLSWLIVERIFKGKPSLMGALTGAVVGLVAITPSAGFVTPLAAIIIGLAVSPVCYFAVSFVKTRFGYDDALDAFGCHGVGGIFGAIATGFFATKAVNPAGANGLFYGNPSLVLVQGLAVIVTIVFSGVMSFLIIKGISLFSEIRVSKREEERGLDLATHGEDAYPDSYPNVLAMPDKKFQYECLDTKPLNTVKLGLPKTQSNTKKRTKNARLKEQNIK